MEGTPGWLDITTLPKELKILHYNREGKIILTAVIKQGKGM